MAEKIDSLGMVKCPTCGEKMKSNKLAQHTKNVHPKGAKTQKERMLIEERREKFYGAMKYVSVIIVVIVAVLALVFIGHWLPEKNSDSLEVGDTAPGFSLKDTSGATHELQFMLGDKPILIEFFATTCAHCHDFASILEQIYDAYGTQIEMYSIAVELYTTDMVPPVQEVVEFKNQHGSSWTYLIGSKAVWNDYKFGGTPSSVIIAPDGTIEWVLYGGTDYTTVAGAIEGALA